MASPVRLNLSGQEGKHANGDAYGNLYVINGSIDESNKSYESTNFVAAVSPVVHDFEGDTGRTAVRGYLVCDTGNLLVEVSRNGLVYDEQWTIKSGEVCEFDGMKVSKLRITYPSGDTDAKAYRANLLWI